MPFSNIGDIDLHYEIHGEGFPLLFIGGLSGSTWTWEGQISFFEEHYKCIVFDNRGAGLSGKPPGPYTIAKMAEDALRLLDRLLIEKTLVFSLSMGGMIALELARIASGRLGAMLLGCTHAGGKNRISPSAEAVSLLMNNAGLSREEILRKQTPLFFSERFRSENSKAIEEHYRLELLAPLQPEYAFQAQLTAIYLFDCTDALAKISNPALVVTGTEDVLIPPANSTYLAEHLPNAELIQIRGAGHALHVECRDILNRATHRFYRKHLGETQTP
jgi:pimeloyl-ACP methyl ester carboxylesterase